MSDHATVACTCGTCASCLAGAAPHAPVADPILFRHSAIRARLLATIGSVEIDGARPLDHLASTDSTDPAIAFLDAFAGGLHVLAWNTRRIGDDGTLARGEDRDAVAGLTALLGYAPRPALAATTTLAFTLDDLETSPKVATLPKGVQIASVPASPTELPLTFETDAEIEARAEWNSIRPVLGVKHQRIDKDVTTVTLASATTAAKVGDIVLIYDGKESGTVKWLKAKVSEVIRKPDATPPQIDLALADPVLLDPPADLSGIELRDTVIVLGQRAAAFGATAPDIRLMPKEIQEGPLGEDGHWKNFYLTARGTATGGTFELDAVYAEAIAGRVILAIRNNLHAMGLVTDSKERARAAFALSAKVSRITVIGINLDFADPTSFAKHVRSLGLFIETAREKLLTYEKPAAAPDPATPDRITVPEVTLPPIGRRVILSGTVRGGTETATEVATVAAASTAGGETTIVFDEPVATVFEATTLTLQLNCVRASHGATPPNQPEALGSGSATVRSPTFKLAGKPLAYVPAAGPLGYAPALEVRVGARAYHVVPSLYGHAADERIFTVETVSDGVSTVRFPGPLPTGSFNVTASYRVGGGAAGNLDAGRLSMMMAPVAGVGKVINPVPAEGGSGAEDLKSIRTAAPKSIRTLDRVVALADYEAFAASYRGIGKALATELRGGLRRLVCLTIATSDLTSPIPGSDIVTDLRAAITAVAPPGRALRIQGFTDLAPVIGIALLIDPDFTRADVEANVRSALGTAFSREVRPFARALHRSEVLAVVQGVQGVRAALLKPFELRAGPPEQDGRLLCPAPTLVQSAGLLAIEPAAVTFSEMQP